MATEERVSISKIRSSHFDFLHFDFLGRSSIIIYVAIVCFCASGCLFSQTASHAQVAQSLRDQGKYDEAIVEYRLHMATREKDVHRPKDENPAFYELLIGDTYLEAGRPELAEESYLRADTAAVPKDLVNFKLRHLATWYEEKSQFEPAILLLNKFRDRDPVMFNYDIDRLHKKMLSTEDVSQPTGQ